jgi:hypothetical protein
VLVDERFVPAIRRGHESGPIRQRVADRARVRAEVAREPSAVRVETDARPAIDELERAERQFVTVERRVGGEGHGGSEAMGVEQRCPRAAHGIHDDERRAIRRLAAVPEPIAAPHPRRHDLIARDKRIDVP